MFYDIRKELSNNGLTDPVEFERDEMQYMPSAFEHMRETLQSIDIWPAIDVTRTVLEHETVLDTFTAVFNEDHYDITFDINSLTDAEAYAEKEAEIYAYGNILIDMAYANPVQGVNTDPVFYKEKISRRKSNKADKLTGEIVLTQEEKDEAKTDEKLSEYEIKISNDQDKAISNLHKLTGVDNIMVFDIANENWNTWIPPA